MCCYCSASKTLWDLGIVDIHTLACAYSQSISILYLCCEHLNLQKVVWVHVRNQLGMATELYFTTFCHSRLFFLKNIDVLMAPKTEGKLLIATAQGYKSAELVWSIPAFLNRRNASRYQDLNYFWKFNIYYFHLGKDLNCSSLISRKSIEL